MAKRMRKLSFKALKRADRHLKNNVPKIIGERARRFFELSFIKEGFTDSGFSKWAKRKRENKRSIGKKVLSGRGFLKGSIRRTKTTPKQIRISSVGVAYANIHNQGRGKMPKRQFIGNSRTLEKGLQKRIEHEIRKFLK